MNTQDPYCSCTTDLFRFWRSGRCAYLHCAECGRFRRVIGLYRLGLKPESKSPLNGGLVEIRGELVRLRSTPNCAAV